MSDQITENTKEQEELKEDGTLVEVSKTDKNNQNDSYFQVNDEDAKTINKSLHEIETSYQSQLIDTFLSFPSKFAIAGLIVCCILPLLPFALMLL